MGIIKAAIYGGAGIYAINKITKAAEHRDTSKQNTNNNSQRDAYYAFQEEPNQQRWYGQGSTQGSFDQYQRYGKPEQQTPPSYHQNINAREISQDDK